VTTSVDHEGFNTFDCLTWAAIVYETPVKDTDGDGLLDAWETATAAAPVKDPYGQDLPYLGDMLAKKDHKDVFIEIGYMKTDVPTSYGGGAAKDPHSHLPTPAAIKLMGDAFKNAPVANPDGTNGIRLHVDVGNLEEYQTGEASQYIVPAALARGGEALDESITTAGCARVRASTACGRASSRSIRHGGLEVRLPLHQRRGDWHDGRVPCPAPAGQPGGRRPL